jgi:hypothetical protein
LNIPKSGAYIITMSDGQFEDEGCENSDLKEQRVFVNHRCAAACSATHGVER